MPLYIYLVENTNYSDFFNSYAGRFDSYIVVAKSPEEALKVHPDGQDGKGHYSKKWFTPKELADPKYGIQVTLLGTADESLKEGEVIMSLFNTD